MSPHPKRTVSYLSFAAALFVLAALARAVFHCHIEGTCSFTYDFVAGYHGVNFYIVEHLRRGIFPVWIAHQSVGYPLYMQVQSDLLYVTPWLFTLLDIPYSLYAANIVQICHIILGGLGAFFLAHRLSLKPVVCLFAGVAYFLMGGFFDGSQHVDILRGYALGPWCLAALLLTEKMSWRDLTFRLLVFTLFLLGAYPGQIIASAFVWTSFILGQLGVRREQSRATLARMVFALIPIATIALAFAIPKYLPFFGDFSSEAVRASNYALVSRAHLTWSHLFSLFLNSAKGLWNGDPTLRSHYVGLVVLAIFCADFSLKQPGKKIFALVLLVSLALSADIPLKLFGAVARIFALSRMTIADYKGFITLSLIFLAAFNLNAILHRQIILSKGRSAVIALAFLSAQALGLWNCQTNPSLNDGVSAAAMIVFLVFATGTPATSSATTSGANAQASSLLKRTIPFVVCLLVILEGVTFHGSSSLWRDSNVAGSTKVRSGLDLLAVDWDTSPLFRTHDIRPARIDPGHFHHESWRGFYTGQFMVFGYDASINLLKHQFLWGASANGRIVNKNGLIRFFEMPGCAIPFAADSSPEIIKIFFANASLADLTARCDSSPIKQRSYSSTRIEYEVRLEQDSYVVENEITWKGWSGTTNLPSSETLRPIESFSPYRVWLLPKGNYRFVESFEEPHARSAWTVALTVLLCGVTLLIISRRLGTRS